MDLTNDFRVALPVEQAWAVLTDLERIAPCMPGAQLQEVEGDLYRGIVKIKVGPITAQYKGQATFVDRDEATRVAVLRAEGRETRGQGHAAATITATLVADGDGTAVSVVTDLTVTGRVAQFGRGVLADVSAKLLDQFVESLEKMILADQAAPEPKVTSESKVTSKPKVTTQTEESAEPGPEPSSGDEASAEPVAAMPAATPPAASPAVRRIESPEPQPVNLLDAAGSPVAKRVGPIVAIIAVLWVLKKLLGRRKR